MLKHIDIMSDILNNREIATIIWVSLFFLFALVKTKIRSSICSLLKALVAKQIALSIGGMLLYVYIIVFVLRKAGFWDASAIKDTAAWTFGVAFVMLINSNKTGDDENYIRGTIVDNIKLVAVLEFIINIDSFSLPIEMIVVPVVTFLVVLKTVAETKPEYKQVGTFLGYVLSVFGTVLLVATFLKVTSNYHSFATFHNLRDFLLPPVLTIALLPFIYGMALFVKYESIFNRINFSNDDPDLASYAKHKILKSFHIKLVRLSKWSRKAGILRFSDRNEVVARIENPMSD